MSPSTVHVRAAFPSRVNSIRHAPVDTEELDDPAQPVHHLSIEIDRPEVAERGRQRRQQRLERQTLRERDLDAPALEGAGEGRAEQAQPLHQLLRPDPFGLHGVEGEHAEHVRAGAQRERDVRSRPHALVAGAIRRGRLGKLIDAGEPGDVVVSQPRRGPGELGFHDRRQLLDARRGPRDARTRLAAVVLVERPAIRAQERHDLAEPLLERLVESGGRDMDQAGGELGQEGLEAQALFEEDPGQPVPPVAHEQQDDQQGLDHDQERCSDADRADMASLSSYGRRARAGTLKPYNSARAGRPCRSCPGSRGQAEAGSARRPRRASSSRPRSSHS